MDAQARRVSATSHDDSSPQVKPVGLTFSHEKDGIQVHRVTTITAQVAYARSAWLSASRGGPVEPWKRGIQTVRIKPREGVAIALRDKVSIIE